MSNRRIGYVQLHNEITFLMHFLTQKYVLRKKVRSLSSSFMHLLTVFCLHTAAWHCSTVLYGRSLHICKDSETEEHPTKFFILHQNESIKTRKVLMVKNLLLSFGIEIAFSYFFFQASDISVVKVFPT